MKLSRLGQTSSLLLQVSVIQGLSAAVTFLISIVLARLFNQEVLGIYSYTFGLAALLSTFSEFGTKTSLSKLLVLDPLMAKDILKKALIFVIPLAAVVAGIALVVGDYLKHNPSIAWYSLLFISYMVFLTVFSALLSMIRGFHQFKRSVVFTFLNRALLLIFIVALSFWNKEPFWVILSLSASIVVLIPFILRSIWPQIKASSKNIPTQKFIRTSIVFLLITISLFSLHFFDRVIVKYFTTFAELGYYTAYYNIANLMKLLAGLIPIVIVPLAVTKRYKLARSMKKLTVFSLPPAIIIGLISPYVVPFLYGKEYALQGYLLPWALVLSSVLLLFYSYFNSILVGENPTSKRMFSIVGVDALLSLVLPITFSWLFFFPLALGVAGVPLAVAVTLFIKLLYNLHFIKRLRAINLINRGT